MNHRLVEFIWFVLIALLVLFFITRVARTSVVRKWPTLVQIILLSLVATILLNIFLQVLSPSPRRSQGIMLIL